MSENYQLVIRKGPQPGQTFELNRETIRIGRDPLANITLNDPEVSRQHCVLHRTEGGGYVLEDLGSTNGTFIDGNRLEGGEKQTLFGGQLISMGSGVVLLYEPIVPEAEPGPESFLDTEGGFLDTPPVVATAVEPDPLPPPVATTFAPDPSVQPPEAPLVPPAEATADRRSRRRITIAITLLVLLCLCCLVFMLTAYFYWGDPLMQYLGFY